MNSGDSDSPAPQMCFPEDPLHSLPSRQTSTYTEQLGLERKYRVIVVETDHFRFREEGKTQTTNGQTAKTLYRENRHSII